MAKILIIVMLVLFPALVVRAVLARTGRRSTGRRACGACGYDVAGLTTLICPECGSDLGVVGITTRLTKRPVGRASTYVLWTLASAALVSTLAWLSIAQFPTLLRQRETLSLSAPGTRYGSLEISLDGWREGVVARFEHARVEMLRAPKTGAPPLEVELQPLIGASPWHGGGAGANRSSFGERDVLDWMDAAGLDPVDPETRRQARALYQRLVHLAALGRTGSGGGSGSSSRQVFSSYSTVRFSAVPWRPYLIALWVILWAGGLLWLERVARRRAEEARCGIEPEESG